MCGGKRRLGIEVRQDDELLTEICSRLNHDSTWLSVLAERAFLNAMGGGCQSPVAAHAWIEDQQILMKAISFMTGVAQSSEGVESIDDAEGLGARLAESFK